MRALALAVLASCGNVVSPQVGRAREVTVDVAGDGCGVSQDTLLIEILASGAWGLGTRMGESVFWTEMPGDPNAPCPIDARYKATLKPETDELFSGTVSVGLYSRCMPPEVPLCSTAFKVLGER